MSSHRLIGCVFGCSLLVMQTVVFAVEDVLIFTSPPRERGTDKADELYEPIAQYLSGMLNKKVVYHNPGNWLNYQKEMREGKYDIVFDGPHFISWRIEHLKHDVVARLPGSVEFAVVTHVNESAIQTMEDLIAKTFCTLPPPNLGTLFVLDKFRNPVRQPIVKAVSGESGDVYEAFKKGTCRAAALRTTFINKKLTEADRKQLKIIATMAAPNQGISVSHRLTLRDKQLIAEKITNSESSGPVNKLVERYGQKNDKRFVLTDNREYKGQNQMLEGIVYGW